MNIHTNVYFKKVHSKAQKSQVPTASELRTYSLNSAFIPRWNPCSYPYWLYYFRQLIIKVISGTFKPQFLWLYLGFPGGSDSRESACQCRRHGLDPWVWKISWRRKWLSIPVFFFFCPLIFLHGEVHGQRSLGDYSKQGDKESDMIKQLTLSLFTLKMGKIPTLKV